MPIIKEEIFDELPILKVPRELGEDISAKALREWNSWKKRDSYTAFNDGRHKKIGAQIKRSNKRPPRTRLTWPWMKALLADELEGRLNIYKNPDMRQNILCILGDAGTGKTLASLHLMHKLGANVICSYTTRAPRITEVEGRDHHFVDIAPPDEQILAKSEYGSNLYYATRAQVRDPLSVYVIDEEGLSYICHHWPNNYVLYRLLITRDPRLRRMSGVDPARIRRDETRKGREQWPLHTYDYVIENNGRKGEFLKRVDEVYNNILEIINFNAQG